MTEKFEYYKSMLDDTPGLSTLESFKFLASSGDHMFISALTNGKKLSWNQVDWKLLEFEPQLEVVDAFNFYQLYIVELNQNFF